jgi:hypothetical protein
LKICDYEGVLKTHKLFKEKQKKRISEIQELAKTGSNEHLQKVIKVIDEFPLSYKTFGESLAHLPLLFYRDVIVQKSLLKIKIAQTALTVLTADSALSLKMSQIKNEASNKLVERMKKLSQLETENNSRIIQKLNIVEVEAIQRIHTDLQLSDSMYNEGKFKKTSEDQLIFMDDGQPWIDELDKYDVAAKACAKNIRRKM